MENGKWKMESCITKVAPKVRQITYEKKLTAIDEKIDGN